MVRSHVHCCPLPQQGARGTDSRTLSSNGAVTQFVTRRYVKNGSSGTLTAINLGLNIDQGNFSYDAPGRRIQTNWPTGAIRYDAYLTTGTHKAQGYDPGLSGRLNVEYRVDSAGRIAADRRNLGGSATVDTNRIFGYDQAGRYTGTMNASAYSWNCHGLPRSDPNYGEIDCPIDSLYPPRNYSYDDAENRSESGTMTGPGDQMKEINYTALTYDAGGNVATRGARANLETYRWSSENRLLSGIFTRFSTTTRAASFEYDALGQPVVRD